MGSLSSRWAFSWVCRNPTREIASQRFQIRYPDSCFHHLVLLDVLQLHYPSVDFDIRLRYSETHSLISGYRPLPGES